MEDRLSTDRGKEGYSIFAGTIADMSWPAVEAAAQNGTAMLVPVAVIEQHGPHLPLATDTYGAHFLCTRIREELAKVEVEAVVAPPYYYGLNPTTGMFPGTVTVAPDTMVRILTEILLQYAGWGFKRQFILSHHGAPEHNQAVVETIQAIRAQGVDAVMVMGGFIQHFIEPSYTSVYRHPIPLDDDALIRAPESAETKAARKRLMRSDWGVHAEERETSLIMRWFPETLDPSVDIAQLEPVLPPIEEFNRAAANHGWRDLSPLGYIGDPSVATRENGELYALEAADMAQAIADFMALRPSRSV